MFQVQLSSGTARTKFIGSIMNTRSSSYTSLYDLAADLYAMGYSTDIRGLPVTGTYNTGNIMAKLWATSGANSTTRHLIGLTFYYNTSGSTFTQQSIWTSVSKATPAPANTAVYDYVRIYQ